MNKPSSTEKNLKIAPVTSEPYRFGKKLENRLLNTIQVQYLKRAQITDFLQTHQNSIAGLVCYGEPIRSERQARDLIPTSNIELTQYNQEALIEVWTGEGPFTYSQHETLHLAFNKHCLFGSAQVSESKDVSFEDLTYLTYRSLFDQVSRLGYPYFFRMWNYFPGINFEQNGMERYKLFCIGRHRAFSEQGKAFQTILPAATAVGTPSGPLQIHFLAGTHPGTHIENPRQISAYEYPQTYGPKSPAFARATLVTAGNHHQFFIAGTSSIVGHTTQHLGEPSEQTKETLCNIESLVSHAKEKIQVRDCSSESQTLVKVYIRNRDHFLKIQEMVKNILGPSPRVLYLQGDMCRSSLLVEIEAFMPFS